MVIFSGHFFTPLDLQTFLLLTRALCRSLVVEGRVVCSKADFFCQTDVLVVRMPTG